tara:strand:- start:231 stop:1979 length:1749 start_codon:yes stop_codon:yes gene_type:complete
MNYYLKIDILKYISYRVLSRLPTKSEVKNILNHIEKTHFLIKIFLNLSLVFINLYSILFHFKIFYRANDKIKFLILSKIGKIKILKQDKLFEFFHAVVILHTDFFEKEKIVRIKKKNEFKDFFIDNVVIGSGPSGSITALELLNDKRKTLILEKGNFIKEFKLKHPGQEFLNMWENGGISASLGNAQIKYASAECFGGGSEINSGLYHFPDKSLISNLKKKFNIKNISHRELIRNLEYLNKNFKINKKIITSDKISNILVKLSNKLKIKSEIVPRLVDNNFKKSSMTNSFLNLFLKRGGKVSLKSEVIEIKKINNHWQIRYKKNKETHSVKCNNLFICAGTINTLSLLLKNKLVKKKKLSDFHFHPMIKIIAKFPKKVNTKFFNISQVQINHFSPKYIIGVAASSRSQLKISSFNNNEMYKKIKKNWQNMIIFHATFSLGKGKIFILDQKKQPIVIYNISKDENDLLNEGLNKLSNFLFSIGAEFIYPMNDLNKIILKKDLKNLYLSSPKKFNLSTVHIMGGCPFGENKNKTLLNSFGKLHHLSNIYVNDGSLICGHLLKNPQGTVMALALRNIRNFISNDN